MRSWDRYGPDWNQDFSLFLFKTQLSDVIIIISSIIVITIIIIIIIIKGLRHSFFSPNLCNNWYSLK